MTLAELLNEIATRRQEDIYPHFHRCGWLDQEEMRITGLKPTDGCGHLWSHRKADIHSDDDHATAHTCPHCGKGPWLLKWSWQATEDGCQIPHIGSETYTEVNGIPTYEPPDFS